MKKEFSWSFSIVKSVNTNKLYSWVINEANYNVCVSLENTWSGTREDFVKEFIIVKA